MLSIDSLNKTYPGPVHALRAVSLELERGAFGLLGPNGAGKTTLMRILATLQRPDSGSVQLGGLDLLANPKEARRQIGYLPQEMGGLPACHSKRDAQLPGRLARHRTRQAQAAGGRTMA
ncbi:MAG: ATP-binding cassette domain-containing protein [Planctomycetota bacterium]